MEGILIKMKSDKEKGMNRKGKAREKLWKANAGLSKYK